MDRALGSIALLLSFFTTLPLPAFLTDKIEAEAKLSDHVTLFPIVGCFIGILVAAVWLITSLLLPPILAAGIAIGFAIIITGGLHEDGLADTADGLGGGQSAQRSLEIMKDSRIGSFGVLALILVIGLKWHAIAAMPLMLGAGAIIGAFTLSRSTFAISMMFSNYARSQGLGSMVDSDLDLLDFTITLVIGVLLCLLFAGWAGLFAGALALAAASLSVYGFTARLGGYTGDTLGAVQQITETIVLILIAGLIA